MKQAVSRRAFLASAALAAAGRAAEKGTVYVVPNFHPASCGWLTNFSMERVYCANSYFDHLDRVRDDPNYAFVLSECNNMIAMLNFKPERAEELKQAIRGGRVELVNGFFLESTINLSGGEALVRLGVEGLRWQQKMFGARPRFAWTIDVCGTHEQMPQIAAGLGLEAMVYTRKNPTGSAVHWSVSPDGTRILSLSPGHYSEFHTVMAAADPLTPAQMAEVERAIEGKRKITPEGAPVLILAGAGDYALAPARKQFPSEFLEAWRRDPAHPELRFSVMGRYLDALQSLEKAGTLKVPSMYGGTAYDFDSFWIENPQVKSSYRRSEHLLQAAETLASAASLRRKFEYPSQELYNAWTLMFLNMDRNTLWGSAGGMVFESAKSWDVKDRFEWAGLHAGAAADEAAAGLLPAGDGLGVYNPLSWSRRDPVALPEAIEGVAAQRTTDGPALCQPGLPACGIAAWKKGKAAAEEEIAPPETIETTHYTVRFDRRTGALAGVALRGGKEMLSGPANVVVAEKPKTQKGDPGDFMLPRGERIRLDSTSGHEQKLRARRGPVATVVEAEGAFYGGATCRRAAIVYHDYPRIDFVTELNDIPNLTVVVAEFPLAGEISEVRRGIPYGFSHGAWSRPNAKLTGWTRGIVPAVRWSHYTLEQGGGAAILDRGVTGRELNGSTPILYLYNATDKYYGYPNPWLSGAGRHVLEYALVFHAGDWARAEIPRMAWEYNCPPLAFEGRRPRAAESFLTASSNVVVEATRRLGGELEVRLAECLGYAGEAEITLALPHRSAAITDLNGANRTPLPGGPRYRFPVRPQQIVTLRFGTAQAVAEPEIVTRWDAMVPAEKRAMLYEYSGAKGHPPRGN